MIPVIVIFAPTACGKTAFAKEIFGKGSFSAFKGRGEVVSADSQAVYQGVNIGTAKPSLSELSELPHHCINLVSPSVQFGVGEWLDAADRACAEIYSRGKIPVVLGGSGFYIRSFLLGLPSVPESDPLIRESLKKRLSEEGDYALYKELKKIDPESAKKIKVHDSYRVCRALEVFYASGKPLSSFKIPQTLRPQYDFCTIVLTRNREDIYERIEKRVDSMFEDGLVKEIDCLKSSGLSCDSPAMKAIGYSEFFDEELLKKGEEAVKDKIKADTRRYAKRQYTYMKEIPGAVFIQAKEKDAVLKEVSDFFNRTAIGDGLSEK